MAAARDHQAANDGHHSQKFLHMRPFISQKPEVDNGYFDVIATLKRTIVPTQN
jgi:hypothetical protein